MPRLISMLDREPLSSTYGSFDRTFWAWKFTDFPGARFQEAIFALAWMYIRDDEENEYFHHPQVLNWIIAGLGNWCSLQYRDGSFDEAYPCEHSLAATAFATYYLGETLLLLKNDLSEGFKNRVLDSFRHSCDWLCRNDETHGVLSNHLAAAAAALVVVQKLTGSEQYLKRAQFFINRILERQSKEGWYEEYGGADIGYQTHAIFYLSRIWTLTKDAALFDSLKGSVSFLSYFIHLNGTIGGEYSSRNTSFYFPAGFEILAPVCIEAAAIAKFMRSSVEEQFSVGLAMMDAYNFCPLINNYLFACDAAKELEDTSSLPFQKEGHWEFPEAGLIVHSTNSYQAIFATSKGGVLKVYDKLAQKLALSDCGYWVKLNNGKIASSQSFSTHNRSESSPERSFVAARFVYINQRIMNPWMFMAFRLFTLITGRIRFVSLWLKSLLVKVLVSRRKMIGLVLERNVEFFQNKIIISDKLIKENTYRGPDRFQLGTKFSTIHMGSARYYQPDELDYISIDASIPFERTYVWGKHI